MNQKMKGILGTILSFTLLLTGCSAPAVNEDSSKDKLNIVATTTMLADLVSSIGGERVTVNGLMGPGIDPHLYQASAGDVSLMQKADVVVYNGLHLEGKMGEIFENLSNQGSAVICIEKGLDESRLLAWEDDNSIHDPHIWFDVSLWKDAAKTVAKGLTDADPNGKADYEANLDAYLKELDETDTYIRGRADELPEKQRVLVTAHDAFQYFGKAYGFEVRGLQGISTDAEAGTADVSDLANFIVERQIKAIFVESSVPPKTIEALQAAVKAKGFDVSIGGELYSDSLGDAQSGADTYILTVKANVDTIVDALK
ncbi:metal ABC transporter solute-binding protein, Zn/Mn family [Lacrimispora sphenoides]|uniref:Manganese/zinc/iron transport system substrate-binding protein n=1 Tax=Lacrimispora sphenoides JCM 1415 TaxID=1297793 RepID=A0ABY1CAU6_9FIRM|nr:zinc ABC transporter substrate-binding protein [Lacrimispora sphenoides]SET87238.1 manganese/zinc/iron transport system substrate-binding protein [[Clostridium] sphenoides JCM 1415]SUY51942.1 zinc transport system periplasmic zinc-binding protein TroA [Lacrimispora sphenoides]